MPSNSHQIERNEVTKNEDRAENWYRAYGGKISRGFIQSFGRALSRNEWVVYLALASYNNVAPPQPFDIVKTGCAWPKIKELQEACAISRSEVHKALRRLIWRHRLVERWALYLKRGRRRRIKFFRLLYVSLKAVHLKEKQQLDMDELNEIPEEELAPEYAWRLKAQPIGPANLADEGEAYMYRDETDEYIPRGKRKRRRKVKMPRKLAESAIHPKLRNAIPTVFQEPD